jgi:histidinol dehydrogenase
VLRRLDLRGLTDPGAGLPRPEVAGDEPVAAVREIIAAVRARGDAALRELTARFDGVSGHDLVVPAGVVKEALDRIPTDLRESLEVARGRIEAFHRHQVRAPEDIDLDGVHIRAWDQPLDRAGLYVPGGRAVYPSTVLMTAVIARVAGVEEIALAVPPGPDGQVPIATLAAAAVAGVDEVLAVGGAQAIASLAYGTESIRPVDVIAGPGNVYVAVAKREVAAHVRIAAAFAGPSEVVVVADDKAPPERAAVDVIVQAEHGPDGLAWLVTWSESAADAIGAEIERLVAESPRADDIRSTLATAGYLALVDGPDAAAAVVNRIAPEHLQVMTADPHAVVGRVRHAGAIFVGADAPASFGDYLAGPSHVLPTNGTARFGGALSVADFTKPMHVVEVSPAAAAALAPHVERLAEAEGLPAHALSARLRRERT